MLSDDIDMTLIWYRDVRWVPGQCRIDIVCLLKILPTKLIKLTILSASHNNGSCSVNFSKESVNNILYLTCI